MENETIQQKTTAENVELEKIKIVRTLEKFGEYLENLNELLKKKVEEREKIAMNKHE